VLTAPNGYVLELTGTVKTHSTTTSECTSVSDYDGSCFHFEYSYSCDTYDNLNVYDGTDNSSTPLLQGMMGCNSSGVSTMLSVGTIRSSGNTMTLNFNSGASGTDAGLDLTVEVIPLDYAIQVNDAANGNLIAAKTTKLHVGDTVSLIAVPNSGYKLKDVVAKDLSGNSVKVSQYSFSVSEFVMPAKDLIITPTFTNNLTAAGGLHLDMRKNMNFDASFTEDIKSFKVYDNGGKDGVYEANSNDTLTLAAPEGYRMKLSGSVIMENGFEYLYAYDGKNTKATNLLTTTGSANRSNTTASKNIGTVTSSGRYMTIRFKSDPSYQYAGLDLTVTLVPVDYTVTVATVTGGSMNSDKAFANKGDVVTLTATPDEGYLLNGFIIKDTSDKDVPFRGGDFIDKKGSFTMPASNVTVTPVFTNKLSTKLKGDLTDIFLTIPVTGVKTVVLPEGLNAFKVYDDGGSTGLLTQGYNANGTLVLIAPENAKINATVVAGVASPATFKTYDGESTDATLLGSAQIGFREKYNSTGNAMTFNMITGENVSGTADISINVLATRNINVVSADGGTATSDKTTADRNETVTVTATPDDGLLFKGVKITDRYGDALSVKNYETGVNAIWTNDNVSEFPKTVSFSMPNSDINIVPQFGEELEASDSLFLKTPVSGSETITIPSRVASFNVYDDGGKSSYTEKADGNLVLTAPEGYRFQVSGSVSAWSKDIAHLCVYEGGAVSDDKTLVCGTSSSGPVTGTDMSYDSYVGEIGTTVSEGNTITLRFWTTSNWTTGDGIELVVTLLKPKYGAVTIVRNDDGTSKAVLDGDYNGSEAIKIASPIAVDEIDFQRAFSARTPSTAILPFTLPEGSTTNAEFYQLTEVKQVNRSWKARFDYIGDGALPQANTPYALILPAGQTKLEFNLNNKQAMVQTSNIDTVKVSNDDWLFVGVYSYKVWEPGDEELGLAYAFSGKDNSNEGKFGKIKIADNATKLSDYPYANPLRAYLRKKDAGVVLKARGRAVASPVASFGLENLPETIDAEFVRETANGEKTTFVGRMNTRTGEFKMLRDYDLKGRRVNGTNKARGAYYGKKVIKK
jgi:hypothetical protein